MIRVGLRARLAGMAAAIVCLSALGQEGFPLDGTWRGAWGADQTLVVIVMKWDGESINGTINPGPRSFPFTTAVLDPSDWTVHVEATDRDGANVVIDGKLEDIGSYNRFIEGTWALNGTSHPFRIARE
jgi:hypothetical protein